MTTKRSIPVTVTTFDGDDQDGPEKVIDMCDSFHASWLRKHIFWAACNGKTIEIEPGVSQ